MNGRGRFITFEGIDGAGKSSHIEAAAQWLRARGRTVLLTREPGGTALAEQLREAVLHQPMDALTEVLLVFAARRDHVVQRIRPALDAGVWVLCDRFTDATFAYQGAGRGFDRSQLATLEAWVHGALQPDLTLWFDLDPAVAAARRGAVRQPDRFEQQDQDFYRRVREGYAARREGDSRRFALIDATPASEAVWQQIETTLAALQA
jgi:dTMP kinase